MPKSRAPSPSNPLPEEEDLARSPPGRAEVERAIGRILDRLKPQSPKRGRKASRAVAR
ncbi:MULTISPECIES: hypothetical protein [Methylobacterium]|uniref:hypothetical protein n=1 Tax=Methylobacterium TaxID=407 RepID=UPI0016508BFC|nr:MULTISPECIES: hypothetical protein [Methylobacterium]